MISQKLKELREKYNITQQELSQHLKVSKGAIAMWETNKRSPDNEMLLNIANFFNVTTDYILGNTQEDLSSYKRAKKIPVYAQVAAGIPISAIQDIVDYEEITEELASSGEYFGLVIKGDSMEPKFSTGDVVIVRSQPTIENGEIAIVMVDGENATCKKIKKTPEGIMLIPLNPAYEPTFYTNKQIEQLPVAILGKVVELRAKF